MDKPIEVEDHLGLVGFFAKKFFDTLEPKGYWDLSDIFQVGSIGLMKAINNYDESKGTKFSTFAARCINNELLMMIRKEKGKIIWAFLDSPALINDTTSAEQITFHDYYADETVDVESEIIAHELKNFFVNAPKRTRRRPHIEEREKKVYEYILKGYHQHEIMEILNIGQRVASYHFTNIKERIAEGWG